MTGVRMEVNVRELARLQVRIGRLGNLPKRQLLDAIGQEVEGQTRRRISEEKTAPDGKSWKDWSPKYARTRHGGHSLLEGEGYLLDSIQYQINPDAVEVGSNLVYAAIHQFGGDEVGINIPARPYLGLSPDNEADIVAVVEDFLDQHLRAV